MIEPVRSLDSQMEGRSRVRRHRIIIAAVVLLALLVVVPPFINVNRFRRTIVHSISAGLGRPVDATAVELQLFPRPGFVLHNLTVGEDPAYGAEPVMMAQTVTAGLRASTLWHRRVEIATLRFDAPNVNLVRGADGHWNFESLLRNSPALHSKSSRTRSSSRLPFPYVEATGARIDFKQGAEKLPFSLERANLTVWKESPHEWRLRIRANPVRTDLSVMDAGQIRGEGTLTTGGALMNAPIRGNLEWRRVQLDEIGRLLHGEDDGWRGTVDWTAQARGTLADVSLISDIAIEEFRRAEFVPAAEMDLSAHCEGRYVRTNIALDSLACEAPVGNGHVWLRGFSAFQTDRSKNLSASPARRKKSGPYPGVPVQITLQQVPAEFLLDLLGHVHPGVATDATATGEVNGEADCTWQLLRIPTTCKGQVRATELRLQLAHFDRPFVGSPLQLAYSPGPSSPTAWKLSPVHFSLGGPMPATVAGTLSSVGATLQVTGPADVAELEKLAQSLRIPAFSGEVQSVRGSAQLALTLESSWLAGSDFGAVSSMAAASPVEPVPSRWTGSVQLHDVTLKLAALPVPFELASGQIDLTPGGVEWTALNGTFAQIPFDGSIRWQTPCATRNSACARSFALHTANLTTEHLQTALHGNAGASGLLNLINPWAGDVPQLPEISGSFRADVLSAGRISVKDALLQLRLKGQSAELTGISGKIFGGTISAIATGNGAGSLRWGEDAPSYALNVVLKHIRPDSVGALWHEGWGGGVADARIDLKTQGWSAAELEKNASGNFAVDWVDGILLDGDGATTAPSIGKFERWNAKGSFRNQTLVLSSSQMTPQIAPQRKGLVSPVTQSVTGTVTFTRAVDLRLAPSGISITGPLSSPVVKSDAAVQP